MNLPSNKDEYEKIISYKHAMKQRIEDGMSRGLHLMDAARMAGVPANIIVANISTDSDFKRWWADSEDRPRLSNDSSLTSPEKVKKDALGLMVSGGLFEKLAMIAAVSDPMDEVDRSDLLKLANIATRFLPSTSQTVQVKADMKDLQANDEEEIREEIRKAKEELGGIVQEGEAAKRQRDL